MDFSLFSWKQFLMSWVNNIGPNVYKLFNALIFPSDQTKMVTVYYALFCLVYFSVSTSIFTGIVF